MQKCVPILSCLAQRKCGLRERSCQPEVPNLSIQPGAAFRLGRAATTWMRLALAKVRQFVQGLAGAGLRRHLPQMRCRRGPQDAGRVPAGDPGLGPLWRPSRVTPRAGRWCPSPANCVTAGLSKIANDQEVPREIRLGQWREGLANVKGRRKNRKDRTKLSYSSRKLSTRPTPPARNAPCRWQASECESAYRRLKL